MCRSSLQFDSAIGALVNTSAALYALVFINNRNIIHCDCILRADFLACTTGDAFIGVDGSWHILPPLLLILGDVEVLNIDSYAKTLLVWNNS